MYKLWMFDFDNTIARLEPEVDWAGGRKILEPYLRSIGAPDELFTRIPRGNLPLYDAYRTLTHDSDQPNVTEVLQHASAIIEKIELAGVDRAQPLEGATEILAALKASGAAIAIVTSNSSKTVQRWFDRHGGASVDAIVGRDTLLGLKPAPDMVIRALETIFCRSIGGRIRRRQRRRHPRRAKLRRAILRNRDHRHRARSIARGRRHRNLRFARGARDSSESSRSSA